MLKTNKKKIIKTNILLLNILKLNKNFITKSLSKNFNLTQKQIVFNKMKLKNNIIKEVCMVTGKTKSLEKNLKINRLITNRFIQTNTMANIVPHSKQ
jgi:hypothetical protein